MSWRKHTAVVATLTIVTSAILIFVFSRASFTPVPASTQAEPIDQLLRILLVIGGVIFALCLVLLIYSAIAFRRRAGDNEDGPPLEGHNGLEMAWTLAPLAIVLPLAFLGAQVLRDISKAGPVQEELRIQVTAFQWGWRFEYPQYGIVSGELRLPVNRPVLFELTSMDVVHSFWVPEFRVKQDAVPGMVTRLRITPNRVGDYKAFCAELCGLAHALMQAPVTVVEPTDFEQWTQEQ